MAELDKPLLPQFLFRYRPLTDETIDREIRAIREQYLWLSAYRALNDPMEGVYEPTARLQNETDYSRIVADILNAKRDIGICCFSDTKYNELMWTHYASNYAGICVAYRSKELLRGLSGGVHLVRVAYGTEPPPISTL